MIFTVDIGNSFVKLGYWREAILIQTTHLQAVEFSIGFMDWIKTLFLKPLSHIHVIWMSVGNDISLETLPLWKKMSSTVSFTRLHSTLDLPLTNLYATPTTLGIDRVIAIVGARTLIQDKPVLVIDAGTAITYDYASSNGAYLGGGIAPGINMRFISLHQLTAKLPLVDFGEEFPLVGNTTALSIRSGVINGVISEIEGIIFRYKNEMHPETMVFLTGGDAKFLEKHVKSFNFVELNLIHKGMFATYIHKNSS